jgi:hypothetical protein
MSDWMPNTREKVLAMCHDWLEEMPKHMDDWNIKKDVQEKLQALHDEALRLLTIVNGSAVATEKDKSDLRLAMKAVEAYMREVKNAYFLEPPLTESDFITLKLRTPDDILTPGGIPEAILFAEISKIKYEKNAHNREELGEGTLAIKANYVGDKQKEPNNRQICLQYTITPEGEAPPEDISLWPGLEIMTGHKTTLRLGKNAKGDLHCVLRAMNGKHFGDYGPITKKKIS